MCKHKETRSTVGVGLDPTTGEANWYTHYYCKKCGLFLYKILYNIDGDEGDTQE